MGSLCIGFKGGNGIMVFNVEFLIDLGSVKKN